MKQLITDFTLSNPENLFFDDNAIYITGVDALEKSKYIKSESIDLEIGFPPVPFSIKNNDTSDSSTEYSSSKRVEELASFDSYINFLTSVYCDQVYETLKVWGYLAIIVKNEFDFSRNISLPIAQRLLESIISSKKYELIDILNWLNPSSMRSSSWYVYWTVGSFRSGFNMYQVLIFEKVKKWKKRLWLKSKKKADDYTTEFLNSIRSGLIVGNRSSLWNKYKNITGRNQLTSDTLLDTLIKLYSNKGDIVSDSFWGLGHHGLRALSLWRKSLITELLHNYKENFLTEYQKIKDSL